LLRILIVDDERLARQALRRLLANHPEVEIVGEAESVADALQVIEQTEPQLVFLDIELGSGDGFDVLAALERPPMIVFVTAGECCRLSAQASRA
jgi:two-component system, LytTR family, response regulator